MLEEEVLADALRDVGEQDLLLAITELDGLATGENPAFRQAALALARTLAPEVLALLVGCGVVSPSEERDSRISLLYRELRSLPASNSRSPSDEERFRRTLAELRELQEDAARDMRTYFEAHRAMDPQLADAALRRADELLERLENPAEPHEPPAPPDHENT